MTVALAFHTEKGSRLRQTRATSVGLLLAAGALSLVRTIDAFFCTRSDEVARCGWGVVTVLPVGLGVLIASTFVMARISSRERWGARGAAGLATLIGSVILTRTIALQVRPPILTFPLPPYRPLPLPPFPSVGAFVAGFALAAAISLHADPGARARRFAATSALSLVPAIVGYAWLGEDDWPIAIVALAGMAFGLSWHGRRDRSA
jgi:hypothetical protein